MRGAVVCAPVRIAHSMGKLVFDEVRAHLEHFVQDGASHCAEAVAAHFILSITHTPQGGQYSVITITQPSARRALPSAHPPYELATSHRRFVLPATDGLRRHAPHLAMPRYARPFQARWQHGHSARGKASPALRPIVARLLLRTAQARVTRRRVGSVQDAVD